MNTKLSLEEIELALIKQREFNFRQNIVVPNISWGFLNHEADLLIMSKSGYLTEIEIKRSLSDLKADFKKDHDHSDERIKFFYYCVPESLLQNAIDLCIEHKRIVSGIITYSEDAKIKFNAVTYYGDRGSAYRQLPCRKLFIEEQLQISRLGCMRIWSLKNKIVKIKN